MQNLSTGMFILLAEVQTLLRKRVLKLKKMFFFFCLNIEPSVQVPSSVEEQALCHLHSEKRFVLMLTNPSW